MIDPTQLRQQLKEKAPTLWEALSTLAKNWLASSLTELDKNGSLTDRFPKTINDPVWGSIELMPWETLLLDSPLLQRMRGVRQLGLAHFVYPGAVHDRLEHSRGVVEAAERMMRSLDRNADYRRKFGADPDGAIPTTEDDRISIRLAALLHDIGHGPFSHATEDIFQERHSAEFAAVTDLLRSTFDGVIKVSASEGVAVLLVMSDAMKAVFEHPNFGTGVPSAAQIAVKVVAHILGSRSCLKATYLSGIISGPIDADKLDYMARDSHHAGLPLGLDLDRLICKLEVVTVTPENAPTPELRDRAAALARRRFYEVGISLAGVGAYEQMMIDRVILYDRIYYHHKVRAAEAMLRRLFSVAEEELDLKFGIKHFFVGMSDDVVLSVLGGETTSPAIPSGKERSRTLGTSLRERSIYYRSFAFALRFIAGLEGLPPKDQKDTRAILWISVLRHVDSSESRNALAQKIFEKAQGLMKGDKVFADSGQGLQPEHIIVDFPLNKAVVRGGDILTRTQSGRLSTPNLFFDPERWSQAYEQQKQAGFVYAPRQYLGLVALASRIVFHELCNVSFGQSGELVSKTDGLVPPEWVQKALALKACSKECAEAMRDEKHRLILANAEDIRLPEAWLRAEPSLAKTLAEQLRSAAPGGLAGSVYQGVMDTLHHLAAYLEVEAQNGSFVNAPKPPESDLQAKVLTHLRSRTVKAVEGAKLAGGETDLVLFDLVVVENKVADEAADPFALGANYAWQARRYSIPLCTSVLFVIQAYKPRNEADILPMHKCIQILQRGTPPDTFVEIRLVLPWGQSVPSRAKSPKSP